MPQSKSVYGFPVRAPFGGELEYFRANPHVAGMAGEDSSIVLNPFSPNTPEQQQLVAQNEAVRLWLRKNKVEPKFPVTPDQFASFKGTEYGKPENIDHLRQTLIARMMTGDPSAGGVTGDQRAFAENIAKRMGIPNSNGYGSDIALRMYGGEQRNAFAPPLVNHYAK